MSYRVARHAPHAASAWVPGSTGAARRWRWNRGGGGDIRRRRSARQSRAASSSCSQLACDSAIFESTGGRCAAHAHHAPRTVPQEQDDGGKPRRVGCSLERTRTLRVAGWGSENARRAADLVRGACQQAAEKTTTQTQNARQEVGRQARRCPGCRAAASHNPTVARDTRSRNPRTRVLACGAAALRVNWRSAAGCRRRQPSRRTGGTWDRKPTQAGGWSADRGTACDGGGQCALRGGAGGAVAAAGSLAVAVRVHCCWPSGLQPTASSFKMRTPLLRLCTRKASVTTERRMRMHVHMRRPTGGAQLAAHPMLLTASATRPT